MDGGVGGVGGVCGSIRAMEEDLVRKEALMEASREQVLEAATERPEWKWRRSDC